jgi:hypothetical protein
MYVILPPTETRHNIYMYLYVKYINKVPTHLLHAEHINQKSEL